MRGRHTVDQWRAAVYREPHVTDATRVLLLFLADHMREDMTVSLGREQIARALGRSERRIAERLRDAVGEAPSKSETERLCRLSHRLLDRKVRGQKHVRAVYQGLIPDVLSVTHVCPAEVHRGDSQQDGQEHPENPQNRHPEKPETGSQQDPRGSCLTTADPLESPHDRDVSRDEKAEHHPAAFRRTVCDAHGDIGCSSCSTTYGREVS